MAERAPGKPIKTTVYGLVHYHPLGESQRAQFGAFVGENTAIGKELANHTKRVRDAITAIVAGRREVATFIPDDIADPAMQDLHDRLQVLQGSGVTVLFPDVGYRRHFDVLEQVYRGEILVKDFAFRIVRNGFHTHEEFVEGMRWLDTRASEEAQVWEEREKTVVANLVSQIENGTIKVPDGKEMRLGLPWGMVHVAGLQKELSTHRDLFDVQIALEQPIDFSPLDRLSFYHRLGNMNKLTPEQHQTLMARSLCFAVLSALLDTNEESTKEGIARQKKFAKLVSESLSLAEIESLFLHDAPPDNFTATVIDRFIEILRTKKPQHGIRERGREVPTFIRIEEFRQDLLWMAQLLINAGMEEEHPQAPHP